MNILQQEKCLKVKEIDMPAVKFDKNCGKKEKKLNENFIFE